MDKVLKDIKQALQLAGLRDGMTLSFHLSLIHISEPTRPLF